MEILHLNVKSLNKSIENFGKSQASVKDTFSSFSLTEYWCDKVANNKSLLNIEKPSKKEQKRRQNWRVYSQ